MTLSSSSVCHINTSVAYNLSTPLSDMSDGVCVFICLFVQEAKSAREMRIEEHQRKVKEITTAVMEVVGLCAEHREMVQLRLGEVTTHPKQLYFLLIKPDSNPTQTMAGTGDVRGTFRESLDRRSS